MIIDYNLFSYRWTIAEIEIIFYEDAILIIWLRTYITYFHEFKTIVIKKKINNSFIKCDEKYW